MEQLMKMESINFIINEMEQNKAAIMLKSDIKNNDGRTEQQKCGIILSMRNSDYRSRELFYESVLRIYEQHYQRVIKRNNRR